MDTTAKMDSDVLRHAAIDQPHCIACSLHAFESGARRSAVVRIISENRINIEFRCRCKAPATQRKRQQKAEGEKKAEACFHRLGLLGDYNLI